MRAAADEAIADELRLRARRAAPGSRLPSVRELARSHRASPVTVQRALARVAAEGLIDARPGRGSFVAERPSHSRRPDYGWQAVALGGRGVDAGGLDRLLALPDPEVISLAGGFPEPALLPTSLLASAGARAARRTSAWSRLPVAGLEDLRAWFAREAGNGITASDVLITSGGQAALTTVFRALPRPGDPVVVEAPAYAGALAAARGAGLEPVPVAVDRDGIRVDYLSDTLRRSQSRLMVLQPTYANPHGTVLAPERREAIHALARHHSAFVVEDDYARDLTIDGRPPPPLVSSDRDGHVVSIRSLTKSTAPGLRVAAVVARGLARERLHAARVVEDFFVSGLLQQTALEVVTSPAWQRHLRGLRRELGTRRDALIAALAEHLPGWQPFCTPRGGLTLWVELPSDAPDDEALVSGAAARGVSLLPGSIWFAAEAPGRFLRLSYATAPAHQLDEAVRRIAVVAKWPDRRR
jgi:DNA-binding transcriptional MocR family regulator